MSRSPRGPCYSHAPNKTGNPNRERKLAQMASTISIHPSVDHGVKPVAAAFSGGTLVCKCKQNAVEVSIKGQCAYNHVCGCTQCWKPEGATFAQIAVVARDNLKISANENKLKVVDPSATIQRHPCNECAAHIYRRTANKPLPSHPLASP